MRLLPRRTAAFLPPLACACLLLAAGCAGRVAGGAPADVTRSADTGSALAKAERKAQQVAERDARRAEKAAARAAAQEAKRATKLAAKQAAQPDGAQAVKQPSERDANKLADREARRAERDAEKAAKRATKLAAKQAAQPDAVQTVKQRSDRDAKKLADREAKRAERDAEKAGRKPAKVKKQRDLAKDPLTEARARAEDEPAEPWWPYRVATLEAEAGRGAASESALRAAIARDAGYAPALTRLSRTLYEQGRHAEAVQLLTPALEGAVTLADPERAAVLSGLALHEAALGRDDRARAAMGQLARGDRDDAAGVAAYLAVRDTSATRALRLTAAAVREAPESAANHNNRGIALLRSADPDAAEKAFERAIELDPARPGPYYNLAILERFYRLDATAATRRFQQYWTRSQADPDSLFAELGRGRSTPVAEEDAK